MTADTVLTALPCAFAATNAADGIAVSAGHIRARHCAVNISARFAPGFRNRHMVAMAAKSKGAARSKKGYTLRHTHKKNTRHCALSAARDCRSLKKKRSDWIPLSALFS